MNEPVSSHLIQASLYEDLGGVLVDPNHLDLDTVDTAPDMDITEDEQDKQQEEQREKAVPYLT
jgi:hypothetical protein